MAKKTNKEVIYYTDLLNDDFYEGEPIVKKKVGSNYKYVHKNPLYNFLKFLLTFFIAIPILRVLLYVKHKSVVKNRKVLKKLRGQAFFLYGNHTQSLDAVIPQVALLPSRKVYIISDPAATSIKGLKTMVGMLGALPLPDSQENYRASVNFLKAIDYYVQKRKVIAVYPEAHIWPYYTDIRPFSPLSMIYPVNANIPVVSFVTTYRLTKYRKKPQMVITLSEPFYPDAKLPKLEARQKLRDEVFTFMKKKVDEPDNYAHIIYKHISEKDR